MKPLKAFPIAILITIAAIAAAVLLGQVKHQEALADGTATTPPSSSTSAPNLNNSLSTAAFADFILDDANVIPSGTEARISLYNANWDEWYRTIVAVVTVEALNGDELDALAFDFFDEAELTSRDALLLFSVEEQAAYLAVGDKFLANWDGADFDRLLIDSAEAYVLEDDYGEAALSVFTSLHSALAKEAGNSGGSSNTLLTIGKIAGYFTLASVVIVLIIVFAILSMIDSFRISRYRRRYGMLTGPVFRPILFWHGPRSRWYTRHYHNAPPPPPPRPSSGATRGGGFGGSSGGSSGGATRGGGFGASSGSRPRGNASSSRGGGFGGSRGGGGSSRGGGSRGGGSRGGGFGRR